MENKPNHFYFAYSLLVDQTKFDAWKRPAGFGDVSLPEGKPALALDVDLTFDSPSEEWEGRVPGIKPSPGAALPGVLLTLDDEGLEAVEAFEEDCVGNRVRQSVRVKVDGEVIEAIALTTHPSESNGRGFISERFLAALVRASERAQLPAAHVTELAKEAEVLRTLQSLARAAEER
jgi:hypothetical protein